MGCAHSRAADAAAAPPASLASLRARLVELAVHSSIELSPAAVAPAVASNQLPPHTAVFVSMVKEDYGHFEAVCDANAALCAGGLDPVPHCPACRFDSAEKLESTLARLRESGAQSTLVVGGNDMFARGQAGAPYPSAGSLIETGALRRHGFERVVVGGHPDGHPGLGMSVRETAAVLQAKLAALATDGHEVAVATQFTFDIGALLRWLHETRSFVASLATPPRRVGLLVWRTTCPQASSHEHEHCKHVPTSTMCCLCMSTPLVRTHAQRFIYDADVCWQVTYHIGVYGPTKVSKLNRVAEICKVPSLAMGSPDKNGISLFDLLDTDHDGAVSKAELLASAGSLQAPMEQLEALYAQHADATGLLHKPQLAALMASLAADALAGHRRASKDFTGGGARVVSGPSAMVDSHHSSRRQLPTTAQVTANAHDDEAMPDELALALAAYCEREQTDPGEIVLHWFPFGGWERCVALMGRMRDGAWPEVEQRPASREAVAAPANGVGHQPRLAESAKLSRPLSAWRRASVIDGKAISEACLVDVKRGVDQLTAAGQRVPCLVVVLVGSHPASQSYIRKKLTAGDGCGVQARVEELASTATEAEVLACVGRLNRDDSVDGIIVQLPLPGHINSSLVTNAVAHEKDVDGFTQQSLGAVAQRGPTPCFCPCTPKGCLRLIHTCGVPLRGKQAVVVGASNIVGVPMALLLLGEGCTVSICHIDTVDVSAHTRHADLLVVACGVAGLVKPEWIKPGAIVIDVGINFVPDASKKSGQRMVGDCDPEVAAVAGHLTPVPGGVGPMTVAMLMQNTLEAAQSRGDRFRC